MISVRMRFVGIVALVVLAVLSLPRTAAARTVTGWAHGRKMKIQLVEVSGVELEARTARAFRAMAKAARRAGVELGIRSGFRSHEQQQELYRKFRHGWGNLAARPGYSNHEHGKALDIYIDDYDVYEWLKGHAQQFGFKRTVRREAWHWEYVGGESRQQRPTT